MSGEGSYSEFVWCGSTARRHLKILANHRDDPLLGQLYDHALRKLEFLQDCSVLATEARVSLGQKQWITMSLVNGWYVKFRPVRDNPRYKWSVLGIYHAFMNLIDYE